MSQRKHSSRMFRAGEAVADPQVGDFFLVQVHGPIRRLIQLGQRRRFTRYEASWNHAGLFVAADGGIVEALTSNVTAGNISKYRGANYIVVRPVSTITDRFQILAFARWALNREYGFVTDLNLALWCVFGGKFSFSLDGQMICSGLVARALERAGYIFERDPSHIMPADLAAFFKVHE